jgi:two-component system sensor histidine kinase RegB
MNLLDSSLDVLRSTERMAARDLQHQARLLGNMLWLVRLRWVAICGQLITIGVVELFWRMSLKLPPLLAVIAITAITNLLLQWWLHRCKSIHDQRSAARGELYMGLTMTLDLLSLTVLLYFSGGPTNPFSFFYFVNLALASILLSTGWSWVQAALAIACFSSFFIIGYTPIPGLEPGIRLQGLISAFAACAIVNCYFISLVSRELERREVELRVMEQKRAQSERLEALATLAAGAGHELASPLSTIAVIANDLTKHLEGTSVPESVIEDVSLIRSELAHCRSILDRMSGHAGQAAGEQMGTWTLKQVVDEVVHGLRRADRISIHGLQQLGERQIRAPLQGLSQALRGLVQNGLDVSPANRDVEITVNSVNHEAILQVRDQGPGMTAEVLARVGEPFFTTKEPGQGMGLGLFLTRNVIERLGGTLRLHSLPGQGTMAEVRLPLHG